MIRAKNNPLDMTLQILQELAEFAQSENIKSNNILKLKTERNPIAAVDLIQMLQQDGNTAEVYNPPPNLM